MIERQLQRLVQVEHRRVRPSEVVAVRRQLDTADDRVVAGVLDGDAQVVVHRLDDGLVVEKLRHARSFGHDLNGRLHQLGGSVFIKPDAQVGLRQSEIVLRLQTKQRHLVVCVLSLRVHAAKRDIKPNREPGEILCRILIAQIDDLIEFQPQALQQDERPVLVDSSLGDVPFVKRIQILVHAPGRERGSVGFHVENHEQKPNRLHGLVERARAAFAQVFANRRDFGQFLFPVHRQDQIVVTLHEMDRAFHDEDDAFVKLAFVFGARFQLFERLGFQPGRSFFEPAFHVRANVALGVVFLVDFHDFGAGE